MTPQGPRQPLLPGGTATAPHPQDPQGVASKPSVRPALASCPVGNKSGSETAKPQPSRGQEPLKTGLSASVVSGLGTPRHEALVSAGRTGPQGPRKVRHDPRQQRPGPRPGPRSGEPGPPPEGGFPGRRVRLRWLGPLVPFTDLLGRPVNFSQNFDNNESFSPLLFEVVVMECYINGAITTTWSISTKKIKFSAGSSWFLFAQNRPRTSAFPSKTHQDSQSTGLSLEVPCGSPWIFESLKF